MLIYSISGDSLAGSFSVHDSATGHTAWFAPAQPIALDSVSFNARGDIVIVPVHAGSAPLHLRLLEQARGAGAGADAGGGGCSGSGMAPVAPHRPKGIPGLSKT